MRTFTPRRTNFPSFKKNRTSPQEKSPSLYGMVVFFSAKRERRERTWKPFIPLGEHACMDPHMHKYTHTHMYTKKMRRRGRQRVAALVVMQDARRGMKAVCPPPSLEPSSPSDRHHPTSFPHPFSQLPRWQAGGRTSFPRLTAGRRGEGNENNEIQRSSVTVCSSRLLTRICIT